MLKAFTASLIASFSRICIGEMSFYAVAKGRNVGIYSSWGDCQAEINGFPGARFKKFSSHEEAEKFIGSSDGSATSVQIETKIPVVKQAFQPQTAVKCFDSQASASNTSKAKNKPTNYYAVAKGKTVGVYTTWSECQAQIDGVKFPKYKKFPTLEEAEEFVRENKATGKATAGPSKSSGSLLNNNRVQADQVTSVRHLSSVAYRNHEFHQSEQGYVQCYTDGSCESNGKVGAKAGIGVWFGVDHPKNVSAPVNGPPTNNVAEIQAATEAIKVANECGISKLQINTDSQFLIKCITQWMPKWRKNGWKLSTGGDVKNKEQLEDLSNALQSKIDVKWNYVTAHKGIEGNEYADSLAKAGASNYKMKTSGGESNRYKPY